MSKTHDNLVVVRAGPSSLHPGWLRERRRQRNFDLHVTAFHPDAPAVEGAGTFRTEVPGSKVKGYRDFLRSRAQDVRQYRAIALIDDDIDSDADALSDCFDIGERYGLQVWQPSLTWDSYLSYAVFLQNRRFRLRFVNFIEMMCPFFTAGALQSAGPLFASGRETGIDLAWCRQFDAPLRKCAVVDAVAVRHTRRVGTTKTAHGFAADERYDDEIARVLQALGITFRGAVAYAGVARGGGAVSTRAGVVMRSLHVAAALRRSPMPKGMLLRFLTDHWRHTLFRPLNLARVDLSRLERAVTP